MSTVYLPVQPIEGMTSAQRAAAINREVWNLRRPQSLRQPQDVTEFYYPMLTHPDTEEVAIVGDLNELIRIHPEVDLTNLLALLPEVTDSEKATLSNQVDIYRGASVPFAALIPSTAEQLTEAQAKANGWFLDAIE